MEEKQLAPDQSIELIRQMVSQTRRRLTNSHGNLFIIWGSLMAATAIALSILFHTTGNPAWNWLWTAPIVIGGVITWWHDRRQKPQVKSFTDRLIEQIWGGVLFISIFAFIHAANDNWSYSPLPIVLIVIGTGLYITSAVLHNRYMNYITILLVVFGVSIIRDYGDYGEEHLYELLQFAAAMLLGVVGSGIALNRQVKREADKASKTE